MRLVVATGNAGKAREFREMLGAERFEWSDLSAHREIAAVEETGKTFRANAGLKATYYATQLNAWALADDSGLAVDALNGSPGVLSARWAEVNKTGKGDAGNNATLLKQLDAVPDERRTARFVCVLALADLKGRIVLTTQDSVEGKILRESRGENGFGYDPLFLIDSLRQTTAELKPGIKHSISHRGKALRQMKALMEQLSGLFSSRVSLAPVPQN